MQPWALGSFDGTEGVWQRLCSPPSQPTPGHLRSQPGTPQDSPTVLGAGVDLGL